MKHSQNVVPFPQKKEETGEGFKGQFTNMKLSDLIQLATQGRMSLVLRITQGPKEGKIYIYQGEIIHAVYNKKTGVEAFYDIMSWKKGAFQSEEYIPPPIQSIDLPWEHLLIEAHRHVDERVHKSLTHDGAKGNYPDKILPEEIFHKLNEWGKLHEDIVEIGIFSSMGTKNAYRREGIPEPEIAISVFQAIGDAAFQLGQAFGNKSCEEYFIIGTRGSLVVLCLADDIKIYIHASVDLTQKAILKVELAKFIENIRKTL